MKTLPSFRNKSLNLFLHQGNYFYSTVYWNVIFKTGLLNFVDKYFKALPKKVSFNHEQIKYFDNINSVQIFLYEFLQKFHHLCLVPLWNKKQTHISVQLQDSRFDLSDINAKEVWRLFNKQEKRVFRSVGNPTAPTVLRPFKGVLYFRWLSLFL